MISSLHSDELKMLDKASPEEKVFGPIEPLQLSSLIHSLVHDIGNPMTSIISYSGLIEQGAALSLTTEQISPYAKKITNESWKVMKLVDLLLLSLSERREVSRFTLSSLKETLMQRAINRYGLGQADITLHGFDQSIEAKGDLDQLSLIGTEIISNAIGAYKSLEEELEDGCSVIIEANIANNNVEITFTNPTSKHESELKDLFNLGKSEFPRNNKPPGIGLFSMARTINRWGGQCEISELSTESNKIFFKTRIILPIFQEQ
jgi:nitrogen-specific signal transduction histidine kinase